MPIPPHDYRVQISGNRSGRGGKTSHLKALHTQQGNGTAASLANYLCNLNAKVSYHLTVDNNRNVVRVVHSSDASWSVGNANGDTTNLCFAGSYAEWTEKQWFDHMGNAMEIAAWLMVVECQNDRHHAGVIGWPEISAGKAGITDHRGVNEAFLKAKGHWDVGDNFPWGWFAGRCRFYVEHGTGPTPVALPPAVNLINRCAEANTWLGKRITDGEGDAKGGKFAHFENGSVYWKNGAEHAYALGRHDTWLKYNATQWEHGKLGFPAGPRIELIKYTKSSGQIVPGGVVQTFDGGAIYWQEDPAIGDGYIVEGGIRNVYSRLGYEGGPLGWPTTDERPNGDFVTQKFAHGTVIWHLASQSALVLGVDGEPIDIPKA